MTIRQVEAKDLEWLLSLRNDESVRTWLGHSKMLDFEQQVRWYASMKEDKSKDYGVIVVNKNRVGLLRIDEIDIDNKSVRVGVDIHKQYRRNGYAFSTYRTIITYLFSMGFVRAWLLVDEKNFAAISLYEKLGFIEEGRQRSALHKDQGFRDYIMMSILEEEWNQ